MQCFFPLIDPCDNFPCKRGKTCKLDADKKPGCVCQEPADCPHSANQFDNVSICDLSKIKLDLFSTAARFY